jgi:CheY-like chemotaxis protein
VQGKGDDGAFNHRLFKAWSESMKPRVLIADDHTLVAEGVEKLLEHEFQLCGRVADGRALVRAVEKDKPDIALVDIALPLLKGRARGETPHPHDAQ